LAGFSPPHPNPSPPEYRRRGAFGTDSKSQLGKLPLRLPLSQIVAQQQANGLQVLDATLAHSLAVEGLPPFHKDPFDRLLVAQANVEGAELVTADPIFVHYPVNVLW
jgi:PIN domain nuclease of toxin-antitoxin system